MTSLNISPVADYAAIRGARYRNCRDNGGIVLKRRSRMFLLSQGRSHRQICLLPRRSPPRWGIDNFVIGPWSISAPVWIDRSGRGALIRKAVDGTRPI